MADIETQVQSALFMDRSGPLGNSADAFGRRALHTKIGNSVSEPIPTYQVNDDPNAEPKNYYNEVAAVASGSETLLVSHTVAPGKVFYLGRVSASGENIALYRVKVNGATIDSKRTWFSGGLNARFDFGSDSERGLKYPAGTLIEVTALHERPSSGAFNARIQGIEANA